MKSHDLALLGELEAEIMEIFWKNKKWLDGREVFEILLLKRQVAYTTVMTIIGRLTEKGLLKRSVDAKVFKYEVTYSKGQFLSKVSRQIINLMSEKFGDVAVAHFAKELEKLPQAKSEELVKLLKGAKK